MDNLTSQARIPPVRRRLDTQLTQLLRLRKVYGRKVDWWHISCTAKLHYWPRRQPRSAFTAPISIGRVLSVQFSVSRT